MICSKKNILLSLAAFILLISSAESLSMLVPVRFPDGKDGYGFRPEFNLTICGLKITGPTTFAAILAGIGFFCLKKSITSYIERETSFDPSPAHNQIQPAIMDRKALHYGIAAAACLLPGVAIIGKNFASSVLRSLHGLTVKR